MVVIVIGLFIMSTAMIMLMTPTATYHFFVVTCIKFWQLLQKRNHAPHVLVTHALAPGWHAGGFNTVLNDPKRLTRLDFFLGEVRGRGIKAFAKFALGHTGR